MIKIKTSFTMKVPTNVNQYEMIDFFASMEREVSESTSREERQRIKQDDYSELKEDVHKQIVAYRKSATPPHATPQAANTGVQQQAPQQAPQQPRNNGKPASEKQIALIQMLASKQGLTDKQVTQQLNQAFGTPELEPLSKALQQLTSKQASEFIEALKKGAQTQAKAPQQQTANHNGDKKYNASAKKSISSAQISLIQKMADERAYSCEQMVNKLNKEYNVSGLEQLNQKQASDLINMFPRIERKVS